MNLEFLTAIFPSWNFFICIILVYCFIKLFFGRKRRQAAPGPNIFIGSSVLFKPFAFRHIAVLTKKYGPILELSLFGQPVFILGNYKTIKEAFVTNADNFRDRPKSSAFEEYCQFKGLLFSSGNIWAEQRKFTISHLLKLRQQESLDNIILQQLEIVCNMIDKKNGKLFDPSLLLLKLANNIIMRIVCSEETDYDDPSDFIQFNIDTIIYNFRMSNPINFFSSLKYILKSHQKYKQSIENVKAYLMKIIKEHEISFDESNIRDYVDSFLLKMLEEKQNGKPETIFTKDQLITNIMDLFIAGSETTSSTILWGILYLLHYPHYQTKIQNEIDKVIGCSRQPSFSDRPNLPFTYAAILETQRLGNIGPLAITRVVKNDITIQGYHIPKGAYVIPNLTSIHYDPDYWKNPLEFNPYHFLDNEGQLLKNVKSFWPFSTGSRECLGEALAVKELFLIYTSLLQRYTFKSIVSRLPKIFECHEGAALKPLPFEVSFNMR